MARCKLCSTKFEAKTFLQKHCLETMECIQAELEYKKGKANKQKEKAWNKEKRERKEKLKTKKDFEKDLEKVFNEFIRLRDKDLPCISCEAKAGEYRSTAGHFYPAGSYKNLRFNEDNVHAQCWWNCNSNKSGNLLEYRPRLIEKIGIDRVEKLTKDRLEPLRLTVPELILMKVEYKEKIRLLKKSYIDNK